MTSMTLTDEVVILVKANAEGWNINQWAADLCVSHNTIRKIVYERTHKGVGTLNPSWIELRQAQRPGRKTGDIGTRTAKPPSHLLAVKPTVLEAFSRFCESIADRLNEKPVTPQGNEGGNETGEPAPRIDPEDVARLVVQAHSSHRGRTAKLTTREVMQVRQDMAAGLAYQEIAEKYGISRPLIAKVCGRGQYDLNSYVPSDHESVPAPGEINLGAYLEGNEDRDDDAPDA